MYNGIRGYIGEVSNDLSSQFTVMINASVRENGKEKNIGVFERSSLYVNVR